MYLVQWLAQCPLVVELHVVVDELCCYQEQDYNHWYDPTHRCAFGIRPVLGRLDVFTPVEVVLGHFWNYWKILSYASLMTSKYVTENSQLSLKILNYLKSSWIDHINGKTRIIVRVNWIFTSDIYALCTFTESFIVRLINWNVQFFRILNIRCTVIFFKEMFHWVWTLCMWSNIFN